MDALAKMVVMVKAVSDYKAGASIQQLSDKYEVPRSTLQSWFKKNGIKMRRAGRPRK